MLTRRAPAAASSPAKIPDMQLLKGLSIAVILLSLTLGVVVGINGQPDESDAQTAKQEAYDAALKKARATAADEAYPLGLKDGMEKGNREGRRKGKAAGEKDAGPTSATGSTGSTNNETGAAAPDNTQNSAGQQFNDQSGTGTE